MLRLIKEFDDINIFIPDGCDLDSPVRHSYMIDDICSKGKEIAINLNDEIKRKNISDNDSYKAVTLHKITYDSSSLNPIGNHICNPYDKNEMMTIDLTGSEIKDKLYKIPGNILTTINLFYEYSKNNQVTYRNVMSLKKSISLLTKTAIELLGLVCMHNGTCSLTEAQMNNENLDKYMNELESIIDEIREYYEKSDYSKILTPRKKKIEKMREYLLGALDRKYTLRIPLYKIEDASKDTRNVIENKFIKDIQSIIAKYDNYVLLSPNWDEDEDIYIYLTLKEPFGEKEDNKDRKTDSQIDQMEKSINHKFDTNSNKILTEATDGEKSKKMTKKERDALRDDEFGLPSMRKYPLNDEEHIRQAVRMFHYCKGPNKQELANNIAKKVREKGLVGKITVSKKNPFKKYFPSWMIEGGGVDDKKSINEGAVVKVDTFNKKEMNEICRILKSKGYKIKYSAQDNFGKRNEYDIVDGYISLFVHAYIYFDKKYNFKNVPKGWVKDEDNDQIIRPKKDNKNANAIYLRKPSSREIEKISNNSISINDIDDKDRFINSLEELENKYLSSLKSWANSLPNMIGSSQNETILFINDKLI